MIGKLNDFMDATHALRGALLALDEKYFSDFDCLDDLKELNKSIINTEKALKKKFDESMLEE